VETPIVEKKDGNLHLVEAGTPYPKKLLLTKQVSIILSSRHLKMSRFCRFEEEEAYVDQSDDVFVQVGIVRLPRKSRIQSTLRGLLFVARACQREEKKEESMPATLDVGARQDEQMQ
jgi:hypothetical protein